MKENKLDEIIEKAVKVFRTLETSATVDNLQGRKTILTGEGLTRKELRMLERKGLVRKLAIYREKKYKHNPATLGYCWEWVGASEQ